ncbi:pseudouridine synthase [Microbulbifer sp.]|uniref:pseudouridine synthase n=1 Tax=Microbulbifer sp. TaxID=1908541 RepID=UPI002586E8EE|nr:pseudouridine synthase [Microbulbifer sp.]
MALNETGSQALAQPQILYQDEALVAAYKPEGWLVHRSSIDRHETRFLLQTLRDQVGCHLYPIHRLDKPTSGVIVFGKSGEIAARVQAQMENDNTLKQYLAVCRGYCPESGTIDYPLPPVSDFRHQRKRPKSELPRQEAVTLFQRLDTVELPIEVDRYPTSRYSLVSIQLKTGRRHQIRRHFKHIHHPLIGCPKYGKSVHNRFFTEHFGCARLLLHASRLELDHPMTGERLKLEAPLQGSFRSLMDQLGWQV